MRPPIGSAGPTQEGPGVVGYWLLPALLLALYAWVSFFLPLQRLALDDNDFGAFYYPAARAILAGRSPFSVPGLIYPPLLPFVLLPLALLSYGGARIVWFVLSHLMLAAAGLQTWRALGADRTSALVVMGAWATSGAVYETLRQGQINAVLLALIVLAIWPRTGTRWLGSSALGFAIALKLWPAVLLLADAIRCRWRSVLRTLGVAVLLLGLPWLLVAAFLSGPATPPHADFWMGSPAALNSSLPAVALRLLDRPERGRPVPTQWVTAHSVQGFKLTSRQDATSLAVAVVLFGAGAGVLMATVRRRGQAQTGPLLSAAFIALALASAPVVWPHYHLLQLPGMAMLGERFIRRQAWPRLAVLGLVGLASTWSRAVIMGPYLDHFGLTATEPSLIWTLTSLTPVGAVAIWLLLLAELRRASTEDATEATAIGC